MENFTKIVSDTVKIILSNYNTEPITLKFDKDKLKKIVYSQTPQTLANPYNTWDSNFIICGLDNNLTIIDVDNLNADACKTLLPILFQEAKLIVKTRKGYHFWFNYNPNLKSRTGGSNGFDILSE